MSNAPKQRIPFSIGYQEGFSERSNVSTLVNLYAHLEEAGGKNNHILINTDGAEHLLDAPNEEMIYGIYQFKNEIYMCTGSGFYRYNPHLSTSVSIQATGATWDKIADVEFSKKVWFADNGIEMVMVAENGYSYNPTTEEFKNMSTEDGWYPSDTVAYMDGYFIFNRTGTGQFFISKLYSTELNPIDWATGESAPDDTVVVAVANRHLWIIGERTSEVWYDSGDPDFPFTRIGGGVTDVGCAEYQTLADVTGTLFFVGNDYRVYMTTGYQVVVISTPAIERQLLDAEDVELSAFSYYSAGHWFYVLHIGDDMTLVYDIATKQWHRRISCDNGTDKRWIMDGAFNLYGTNEPFAWSGAAFYNLGIHIPDEAGTPIRREAVSIQLNKGVDRIRLYEVDLDMDTGDTECNSVVLKTSSDNGNTWSPENVANCGGVGSYRTLPRWYRLGLFRYVVLKIIITDKCPVRISGLFARFG